MTSLLLCTLSAIALADSKPASNTNGKKQKISITKVYDFACPWCYVGKKRLDQAMAQRPDIEFSISWVPYQLNPDMPREGRNRWEYYRKKFGEDRVTEILEHQKQNGKEEGIAFCSSPEAMAPNTLSAHTLMYWAGLDSKVDADLLADKLYYSHHVACENIGDHEVLIRIAGEVGMDKSSVAQKLVAGTDEEKVKQLIDNTRANGVNSIPYFVLNNRYRLKGARSVSDFIDAFDYLREMP